MGKLLTLNFEAIGCAERKSTIEKLFDGCFIDGLSNDLMLAFQWAEEEIALNNHAVQDIDAMHLKDWYPDPLETMVVFVNLRAGKALYRIQSVDDGAVLYCRTDNLPNAFLCGGGGTFFLMLLGGLYCLDVSVADWRDARYEALDSGKGQEAFLMIMEMLS